MMVIYRGANLAPLSDSWSVQNAGWLLCVQAFVKQCAQWLQQEAITVSKAQMTHFKYLAGKHCCRTLRTNTQAKYSHPHAHLWPRACLLFACSYFYDSFVIINITICGAKMVSFKEDISSTFLGLYFIQGPNSPIIFAWFTYQKAPHTSYAGPLCCPQLAFRVNWGVLIGWKNHTIYPFNYIHLCLR